MSQANVEIVSQLYAATEQGNFRVAALFDPQVRVVWLDGVGFEKETVGLQAMGDFMRTWLEGYARMTLTAEQLIDAGDQVVAIARWRGQGRASGVVTDLLHGSVYGFREGRVVSLVSYSEPREALAAAGL
jgi:ketosteroid isomerase-like protein